MGSLRTSVIVTLVLASACGTGDPELSLLDAPRSEDWEARRRRMDVTISVDDGMGTWSEPTRVAPSEFRPYLAAYCDEVLGATSPQFNCSAADVMSAPGDCQAAICESQMATCLSLTYLEIAEAVGQTELLWAAGGVRVPPQDTAVRAGLAEESLVLAQRAVVLAGENLRLVVEDESALEGRCEGTHLVDQQTMLPIEIPATGGGFLEPRAAALAATLVEMTQVAERAGEVAAERNAAVADSDLSSIPNVGQASRAAWMAPFLSRLHGAQLLTGGTSCQGARS